MWGLGFRVSLSSVWDLMVQALGIEGSVWVYIGFRVLVWILPGLDQEAWI